MGDEDFGEFDFDLDISEPTFEQQTGTTAEPLDQQETSQGNPAWDAIFNEIPREFHSKIEPTLKTWDQGVKSQFEKRAQEIAQFQEQFKPWQEFQQRNITPQQLNQAYAIMEQINSDPRTFYSRMTELLKQQGLLEQEQKQQEQLDEDFQQPEVVEDPRLVQLQAQLQQTAAQQKAMINFINMQQQTAQAAQAEAAIDARIRNDMATLESKTGPLPDWLRTEVIDRAVRMSEAQQREVPLQEAYMDFQRVRQQMLSTPRPGQQAPRVVPGGSGYASTPPNPDALKTSEGRSEAIRAILQQNGIGD